MATNDDQAKALIDALAPKLAESLLPTLQKQFEEQIQGVVKKNEELLDKLSQSKLDYTTKLLAAADDQQKARLNADRTINFRKDTAPVRISKVDARDPVKYREAKDLAAKQGVRLEIDRG